jgi:hypothetical protein
MKNLIIYILTAAAFASCTDTNKEDNLAQREQALSLKEQEFLTKEADYQQLLSLRDSLEHTAEKMPAEAVWPEEIMGKWSGKMICTESSCSEHVVGDTRNDIWEFSPNGLKITNKTGGERHFTGNISGTDLTLSSTDSATAASRSKITLALVDLASSRLKGSRELTGKDNCVAKFSVELEKAKN